MVGQYQTKEGIINNHMHCLGSLMAKAAIIGKDRNLKLITGQVYMPSQGGGQDVIYEVQIEADKFDALIAAAKADLKIRNKDTPSAAKTWKVITNDYGNLVVEEKSF